MDNHVEKKTTSTWNKYTESFFSNYFQRKHEYFKQLLVPHTKSNLLANMRKDLNADLDLIYNFHILSLELLNGGENFEGALPRAFKSPLYLIVGIIDLCLNLIILAISLMTCRTASLFHSENHKHDDGAHFDQEDKPEDITELIV